MNATISSSAPLGVYLKNVGSSVWTFVGAAAGAVGVWAESTGTSIPRLPWLVVLFAAIPIAQFNAYRSTAGVIARSQWTPQHPKRRLEPRQMLAYVGLGTYAIVIATCAVVTAAPAILGLDSKTSPSIIVTYPTTRIRVDGSRGVVLTGTATAARGDRLWVFDQPREGDNRLQYLDNEHPIKIARSGSWTFHDAQIGEDHADNKKTFLLTPVLAPPSCNRILSKAQPDGANNVVFQYIPDSCIPATPARVIALWPRKRSSGHRHD